MQIKTIEDRLDNGRWVETGSVDVLLLRNEMARVHPGRAAYTNAIYIIRDTIAPTRPNPWNETVFYKQTKCMVSNHENQKRV